MSHVNQPASRTLALRHRLVLAAIFALASGCSHSLPSINGAPSAPPARDNAWRVPRNTIPAESLEVTRPTLPTDIAPRASALGLNDVVDVALRNNPQTLVSWAQARSGAATYGAARGELYPSIDIDADFPRYQTGGGNNSASVSPVISLSYLLLDFGGRSGSIAAARAAAVALDLTHNATLQNVALQAEAAYFTYQAQRQLVTAARITVAEADTNLASARQRNTAGVATIADVLQAETQLAQAQLDLETAEGGLQTARGSLAVSMGLPPNAAFNLAPATDSFPVAMIATQVDTLINRALLLRPDLAALRMGIEQARAEVRIARSNMRPSVTLGTSEGQTIGVSGRTTNTSPNFSLQVGVHIPIFNLARPFQVKVAEEQVTASRGRADLLRTQVAQEVYTSYYALQTATQRARTAATLLASAIRSEEVARARYRAGVGTIVDLLTAQTALASARAQQAQARWSWGLALAQLSHDVGVLGPMGEPLPPGADRTGLR